MEAAFESYVASGKINGAVICATDSRGQFVYSKALGRRTLVSGETRPQQLDDVLYLASATKLITTIAALQCVEDGLLTLRGDLSSIAPDLAAKPVLTGWSPDGETPILEAQTGPITLEMLLTHTSGMAYHFLNPAISRWRDKSAPGPRAEDAQGQPRLPVEDFFGYPLSFQPGTSWMYGPGLDWAGRIIERVTGQTLGERIRQRILDPLGISDAQFYPVTRDDLRARLVDLNPQDPEALGRAVLGGGGDINKLSRGDFGGQGLFMTGPDLAKILRSLLASGGGGDVVQLLQPATVDDMFENHLGSQASAGHRAALQSPMGPFFRVGVELGTRVGYGLGGLLTLEDVDGWYGERTMSWGGGATLAWFIDRRKDLCGVGAVQAALPFDHEPANALKDAFRHGMYNEKAAWEQAQRA